MKNDLIQYVATYYMWTGYVALGFGLLIVLEAYNGTVSKVINSIRHLSKNDL